MGERSEDGAFEATVSASTTDRTPGATMATGDGVLRGEARDLPAIADERYAISGEIGRGGIGRVLRARDEVLERPVALKQLFATDEASRKRFIREALITARLQHPSIVPIYEAGRREYGSPFYAMRLVAGQPLEKGLAAATTLDARLALLPTVLAVADAIAYAHNERIIHRDLKPANVLVGRFGETVVIDWGLAKDLAIEDVDAVAFGPYRAANDAAHTVAGSVMGTPGYMAPEQAAGEDADERADVYALGAILYHVISGALPHQGATLDEVIAKVIRGDIRPLLAVEPNAPPDLAAIVGKAMAVDKAQRYRNAGELADDLRKFQTGQLVGAHRYTTRQRMQRWLRRNRAIASVVAIATVVLAVVATLAIHNVMAEREEANDKRAIAEEKQQRAVENLNRAYINQARSLRREPARVLALLARMDDSGPGWDAARVLAAEALSHPRLLAHTRGPGGTIGRTMLSRPELELARDGKSAVAFDSNGVYLMDLVAMKTRVLRFGSDPVEHRRLVLCDDARRAYLMTGGFVRKRFYEVDVSAGTVKERTGEVDLAATAAQCDSSRFALTANEKGLVWRDVATGKQTILSTVPMDAGWRTPDRLHVVALDREGSLHRFELTGKALGVIPGPEKQTLAPQLDAYHRRSLAVAASSRDGAVVVTRAHNEVTYWSFPRGRAVRPTLATNIEGFAVAPDGKVAYLSTPTGGYVFPDRDDLFDEVWAPLPRGDLMMSPDGAWLVGVHAGKVEILDRATNVARELRGHEAIERIAFTPDGKLVTTGDDAIRVWELGKPGRAHGRAGVYSGAFSPDGRWLAMNNGGSVALWDVEGGKLAAEIDHDRISSDRTSVAVTDAGDVLFTLHAEVFRWPRGKQATKLGEHPEAASLGSGFLSDGTPITVSHDRMLLWRAAGPRVLPIPEAEAVRRPTATPFEVDARGTRAVVMCRPLGETQRTCVTDLATGNSDVLPGTTSTAAITPDGRFAITGMDDETYAIWELPTRTPTRPPSTIGAVTELGISHDGKRALIGGLHGVDSIDLVTRTQTALVASDRAEGRRLQFSPDGKTVVGHDLVLRDVGSGELRQVEVQRPQAWYLANDKLVVVTPFGIVIERDDLPRDPAELKARLLALPYRVDAHDALIVTR